MMLEFKQPIPVITPKGEGYALYVVNNGMWENDVFCCSLCDTGQLLHFTTSQLQLHKNHTFDIKNKEKQ